MYAIFKSKAKPGWIRPVSAPAAGHESEIMASHGGGQCIHGFIRIASFDPENDNDMNSIRNPAFLCCISGFPPAQSET